MILDLEIYTQDFPEWGREHAGHEKRKICGKDKGVAVLGIHCLDCNKVYFYDTVGIE